MFRRWLAWSSLARERRPLSVRLARLERSVYFCPLINARLLPVSRAYSLLRTSSSASPKWLTTWNLSKRMLAPGTCFNVASILFDKFHVVSHLELVEEDARSGNMLQRGATKGFPHVHD